MCTREEIDKLAASLALYNKDNGMVELRGVESRVPIPPEVADEFMKIFYQEPRLIWLQGRTKPSTKSGVSYTGLTTYDSVGPHMNRLFFSAKPRYPVRDLGEGVAQIPQNLGIVVLAYSLVFQAIEALPTEVETLDEIDTECFKLLDGSLKSVPATLELFDKLLDYFENISITWVLDALDLLESPNTAQHLKHLYRIAQRREASDEDMILFITNGDCRFLKSIYLASETRQEWNTMMKYTIRRLPGVVVESD
jgi:hypothetical protein